MPLHKLEPRSDALPTSGMPAFLKQPPAHLSTEAAELWRAVIASGSYDAPARALLGRFCEIHDQLTTLNVEIRGLKTFLDAKGAQHPLMKLQKDLTTEYGRLFRLLGWDQAPPSKGGFRP